MYKVSAHIVMRGKDENTFDGDKIDINITGHRSIDSLKKGLRESIRETLVEYGKEKREYFMLDYVISTDPEDEYVDSDVEITGYICNGRLVFEI